MPNAGISGRWWMMEMTNDMAALNTACERINHALDRIARVGWCRGRMRAKFNEARMHRTAEEFVEDAKREIAGPACLIGSLITDDEFVAVMAKVAPMDRADVYECVSKLPGMPETLLALDFKGTTYCRPVSQAWVWNDDRPHDTAQADIIERLTEGKQKACS